MLKNLSKWRVSTFLFCTIFSLIFVMPNFGGAKLGWLPDSKVNLGLDLKGGAHLLYSVDFDSYLADSMEILADNIRRTFRDEKIGYKNLIVENDAISLILRSEDELQDFRRIMKKIEPKITIVVDEKAVNLHYEAPVLEHFLSQVIDQSIEIIRMRVDSTGTTEPIIHRQGDKYILLQVPGEQNPQKLKNIVGKTAKLTFHMVNDTANLEEAIKGHLPSGSILVKGESDNHLAVIKKKPILSGDLLTSAQVSFDRNSQAVVAFSFNNLGGKIFADATKQNAGKRLAIILDNKLLSAPVINEPILGGSGTISGNFTVESANELAMLLRAGALPAPLKIVEERTVGANLGADSIESGKTAAIIGFAAISVFMIWAYGVLGLFANIALVLALLYIFSLLSILQATLTLPGIAGIVLTMGMAVDANVLIYERIKEELIGGASNLQAIRVGFKSAFATIADSNITTLLVALILYIFGVGAVKGFAVALSIGIISSMFSAIMVTKLFIDLWVALYKPKSLGLL